MPIRTLQNLSAPDFNLERDILNPEIEAEIALGMEATELNSDKRFVVNMSTILISGLVFLLILAWFDFMQTTIFNWLVPESEEEELIPSYAKLWYAIFITIFVLLLVYLIYFLSKNHIK